MQGETKSGRCKIQKTTQKISQDKATREALDRLTYLEVPGAHTRVYCGYTESELDLGAVYPYCLPWVKKEGREWGIGE